MAPCGLSVFKEMVQKKGELEEGSGKERREKKTKHRKG